MGLSTWRARCATGLVSAWFGCMAPSASASPTVDLYSDAEAGIRLPLPFAEPRVKSAAQVQDLIGDHPELHLPPGVHITSAVYAKSGLPYFLIWTLASPVTPTLGDLTHMAALADDQGGFSNWLFRAETARGIASLKLPKQSLNVRILVQLVQGGAVYVAYYYDKDRDAGGFERLNDGLELTTAKRLTPAVSPSELWLRLGMSAAAFLVCAGAYLMLKLR